MAKRNRTEETLAMLGQLEKGPLTPDVQKTLRKTLALANNILVAKAATITGHHGIECLIPDLLNAFDRFCDNPVKRDPGCLAKEAIIEALDEMDYAESGIFLRGVRWIQEEPAYIRPVDTAAGLRARSAFALVSIGYPDAVFELADLLADTEPQPRIAAVRSLAGISGDQGEPLLRLKATIGDDDYRVIAECLSVLVRINADRSIDFVARFLRSSDAIIAENAAFALGESRREEAFEILRRHRETCPDPELVDLLLMPMAITRLEKAFDYLVAVIENEAPESVAAARKAIRLFDDESHRARIPGGSEG
jgi:hypothetical protein